MALSEKTLNEIISNLDPEDRESIAVVQTLKSMVSQLAVYEDTYARIASIRGKKIMVSQVSYQ